MHSETRGWIVPDKRPFLTVNTTVHLPLNSPMLVEDDTRQDIYAIDVKLPWGAKRFHSPGCETDRLCDHSAAFDFYILWITAATLPSIWSLTTLWLCLSIQWFQKTTRSTGTRRRVDLDEYARQLSVDGLKK